MMNWMTFRFLTTLSADKTQIIQLVNMYNLKTEQNLFGFFVPPIAKLSNHQIKTTSFCEYINGIGIYFQINTL